MADANIYHALGLHMHQPPGNLRLLWDADPWQAEEIVRCYERAVRYALQYKDVAKLHVGFSGILLEQFLDPDIVDRYRHVVDIPAMLELYRQADNIELVGMGYYHPIFPLIPHADWPEQLSRGRAIMERVFGRSPRGFWPPEMAFSMEMIPALVGCGYDYVVVDGVHVRPSDGLTDIFRPYVACHEGSCITVVPRDRYVSNAQGSGLSTDWFYDEVRVRVASSARPGDARLVTTWSDGENGVWFRHRHEPSGFFGHFFAPLMEDCRGGTSLVQPVCLSDYLDLVRPQAQARVQTGAWNVRSATGDDFSQWVGSPGQRDAVAAVQALSHRYWSLCQSCPDCYQRLGEGMVQTRRLILEAETSCFLVWGEAWLPLLYARTGPAEDALRRMELSLRGDPVQTASEGPSAGAAEDASKPSQ